MSQKTPIDAWQKPSLPTFGKTRLIATIIVVAIVGGAACLTFWYITYTRTHLPPSTYVNGRDLSWQSYIKAQQILETELGAPPEHTIVFSLEDISIASSSSELGAEYAITQTLDQLKSSWLETPISTRLSALLTQFSTPKYITVPILYENQALHDATALLNDQASYPSSLPEATLATTNDPASLSISTGVMGREINQSKTIADLHSAPYAAEIIIQATAASTGAELRDSEIPAARQRAEQFVGKQLRLEGASSTFTLTDQELVSLLELPAGYQQSKITEHIQSWDEEISRPAQEPELEYDSETLQVSEFLPPKDGLQLLRDGSAELLTEQLALIESGERPAVDSDTAQEVVAIPIERTKPAKSLAETNDLGIVESIGYGESTYQGSIPNRIHNVALSASGISNQIIPPGAEYSFNNALGPVNASTGYRSAYVIKNGMTTLGDGGGVCQTSTTLFRTALNAGLEITRRLPHSYRVGYYEQDQKPGIDATVYTGETDLRFRNDTNNHILLYAEADSENQHMFIEMYGTSDGRTTEIVDHQTWNERPAPPAQYFPDESLAPGQLRQIDWAAPGINASFTNIVRDAEGNEIRRDTYNSNYRPWAAKYLQGV